MTTLKKVMYPSTNTWKDLLSEMRRWSHLLTSGRKPTPVETFQLTMLACAAQEIPPLAEASENHDEYVFNCLLELIYDVEFEDCYTIRSMFDMAGEGRLIKIDPYTELEDDDGHTYHPVYWTAITEE